MDSKSKEKRSKRLGKSVAAAKRQQSIYKAFKQEVPELGRLTKSHAFNCGIPSCAACGNPRKFFGEPTIQEKRFFQTPLITMAPEELQEDQ